MPNSPIREASVKLLERYRLALLIDKKENNPIIPVETTERLLGMIDLIKDYNIPMYDDKVSRWVGFIQGTMIALDMFTIDNEREVSREIFHEAYEKMGLSIPNTISV